MSNLRGGRSDGPVPQQAQKGREQIVIHALGLDQESGGAMPDPVEAQDLHSINAGQRQNRFGLGAICVHAEW